MIATVLCVVGLFCAPVVQHMGVPPDEVTSITPGVAQQAVDDLGTILLAHSVLTGGVFYNIEEGDLAVVWYEDAPHVFIVDEISQYEMLPERMRDMSDGQLYTAWQVYEMNAQALMLMTCLDVHDDPIGGRLIIKAVPYE